MASRSDQRLPWKYLVDKMAVAAEKEYEGGKDES
jgi:hypothetical protein